MSECLSVLLVVAYLVGVKIIALRASRRASLNSENTSEDYFLYKRNLSGLLLWATILATVVNSLAFTAVPGLIYSGGILFLQMWVVVICLPLLMRIFGPAVASYARRNGIVSQGELFGHYYHSAWVSRATAVLAILSVLPFMTIQLTAIAKIVSVATSGYLPYWVALLIFGASTGVYIFYGGARAVVATDVFQGICFSLLLAVFAALFCYWVGGYSIALERISSVRPTLFSFTPATKMVFLDNVFSWPLAFFLWPQLFQRLLMARSSREIKRSAFATLFLFSAVMLLIMTIGLMATAQFVDVSLNPDTVVAEMINKHLPLAAPLMVLAVVASGMSTLDSGLLSLTAVLSRDFALSPKTASDSPRAARSISLLLLTIIIAIGLSDSGRGAIAPLVTLGASFAALFLWPLLGMTYLPRVTSHTVLLSYCAGVLGILLAACSDILPFGPGLSGFICAGSIFGLGLVFYFWPESIKVLALIVQIPEQKMRKNNAN